MQITWNYLLALFALLVLVKPSCAQSDTVYVNSAGYTIFKASTSSIDSITFSHDSKLKSCYGECSDGYKCVDGTCLLNCQAGLSNCGGTCVNEQTDPFNCGACGTAVPAGHTCAAGAPSLTCQAGLSICGGTCVNEQTDPFNCGACGTAVPAGSACQSGSPEVVCPISQTMCGGLCYSLASDINNCGYCGYSCGAGTTQRCVSGVCK